MKDFHVVHPGPEQWQAYSRGGLGPEERAELERHLADCASCRQAIQTLPSAPAKPQPDSSQEATAFLPGTPPDSGSGEGTAAYFRGQGVPLIATVTGPPGESGFPDELANHPRYRLLEYLGAGGMGTVFKAEHRLMGRVVALKVIHPNLVDRPGAVERFRREVQAAARLSHPNIVTAYDAEQAGPTHFLVMEFVEGRSVGQVLAEQGRLPVTRACDYARQVALGLQHAYERDMVHRDIKPHNLMVTPAGQIKILDFGLARLAMEDALAGEPAVGHSGGSGPHPILPEQAGPITEAGAMMGTADYVAPEQAGDAHKADIRADIYSLGCTLYHFLAGQPPFPEGTAVEKVLAHAQRVPRPLQELRKEVPPKLARIVERMLAKDPAQRYQTPAQVAQALAPFAGVITGPPRWRRLLSGLAAALLLALLGFWTYWYGPEVYLYARDQGRVEFQTEGKDLKVIVKQEGKQVLVVDTKTDPVIDLKAGAYQVEPEERQKWEIAPAGFILERGGRQTLRVSERPLEPPPRPPFRPNPGREGGPERRPWFRPNPESPRGRPPRGSGNRAPPGPNRGPSSGPSSPPGSPRPAAAGPGAGSRPTTRS